MASRVIITSLALVALLAMSYGHEAPGSEVQEEENGGSTDWVSCVIGVDPKFSCYDCHTRIICTPVGGRLVKCYNPFRPYCDVTTGFCSHTASEECSSVLE